MSKPQSDMPPRFVKQAISRKLVRGLEFARAQKAGELRVLIEQKVWDADSARGTRYQKRATASQQKRRKQHRRAYPHGWKGGMQ